MNKDYILKLLDYLSDSDIDKSKFGPFYNLMLLPIAQISEPVEYRLRRLESFQGLTDYSFLSDRDMEIAASNHLVFRKEGSIGTGYARIIVRQKSDITIPAKSKLTVTVSGKKLEFEVDGISFTADQFTISTKYPSYFISPIFSIHTSTKDADYNSLVTDTVLQSSLTDSNVVKIVLDSMTTSVVNRESNSELYTRLLNQVGSKQLNTEAGVINLFSEYFPTVPVLAVYGNTDTAVTRNTIKFYTPTTDEEWYILNFKGKVAGSPAIPHFAFEYLLTQSGVEFEVVGSDIELIGLNDPTNFLLYEASQTDYNSLNMKLSEAYFETGHGVFLNKDTFVTDPSWVKSDCLLGSGRLFSSSEITISGTQYILGTTQEEVSISQFIKDLIASKRVKEEGK